ncbi:helix-turn-helix transcriptional regulator [Diplocloster hominis]|uniref:helix-turn-helix domain-containing protein n=1 Tax=Diplocloster hominis TaxID=3079010 RepID=UPI0031BABF44
MTLGDRIKCILSEKNMKQVEFASTLGISANYVNQLVNGKKTNISETLAKLIEERFGYSAEWIINESGSKLASPTLSAIKKEFIRKIRKMPDEEVLAMLAFAETFASFKRQFGMADPETRS